MIELPHIDPVALHVGVLKVHWYGLSYLVGIGLGWLYLHKFVSNYLEGWSKQLIDDLVFYSSLGAVLGGRLGYVIFYDLPSFLQDPKVIFAVWKGGMSFHGGLVGVSVAFFFVGLRSRRSIMEVSDFILPAVPIGLAFGRLANFINQELWGTPSELPWAVIFSVPAAGYLPRHPSQLYEAFAEGLLLFVILNLFTRKIPQTGRITAVFLILYGGLRFFIEFVRAPDVHIGYIGGWLTMGQILSLPMVVIGLIIWFSTVKRTLKVG